MEVEFFVKDAPKALPSENKTPVIATDELSIANQKLIFENQEKEKRAAELVIANKELHDALMNTVRVAMILSELRDPTPLATRDAWVNCHWH